MSTRKVLTLASMAMLFSPAAFSAGPVINGASNPYHVVGEKLDSGLGDLAPGYSASEFRRAAASAEYRVVVEKLDSGLGELSPSYTAAELQPGYQIGRASCRERV